MDIARWIGQAKDLSFAALARGSETVGAGVGFVKSAVGRLWVFGSTETSASYDQDVDEKHYFLVPDRRCESHYSLYVMRCLPDGVPPLNSLPKRRLFHLPSEHALPTVEHILLTDARQSAEDATAERNSFGARLRQIADEIDRLDGKVFNGVLLIGGLVALVNPLAGAAVAMKAMIPSVGLLLSKYGLQYVGDAADARSMTARIKNAEREVLEQFRAAGAESLVNPLLAQMDRALATSELEYDPVLDFDAENMDFGACDRRRFFRLTCQAILNTYDGVFSDLGSDPNRWSDAHLGPEDIRFLQLLRSASAAET